MQLEFFFQPCRYDGTKVEGRNPFTGENALIPNNEPLNSAESRAVKALLDKAAGHGPDENGFYRITLDDGCEIGVYASHVETGCMVTFRWLPTSLFQFAIDLLKAGNWVLLPAVESTVAVVTSMDSVKGIPDNFPPIVVSNSAEDLKVLITVGFDAWKQIQDGRGKIEG
jgi:hypothetical protein